MDKDHHDRQLHSLDYTGSRGKPSHKHKHVHKEEDQQLHNSNEEGSACKVEKEHESTKQEGKSYQDNNGDEQQQQTQQHPPETQQQQPPETGGGETGETGGKTGETTGEEESGKSGSTRRVARMISWADSTLKADLPLETYGMLVAKLATLANGPCSPDEPHVTSTEESPFSERLNACIPDKQSIGKTLAAEGFIAVRIALKQRSVKAGAAYFFLSSLYWVSTKSLRSYVVGVMKEETEIGVPDPLRQTMYAVQDLLRPPIPHAQPPTLFEYLSLDASKPPFFPYTHCLTPHNKNYHAAIEAIHYTYILGADDLYRNDAERVHFAGGGTDMGDDNDQMAEQVHVFHLVVAKLLNDTFRAEYMKVFLPAMMGESLKIDIDHAVNRQQALDNLCKL